MIIIAEGPDKTGKTTLLESISKKYKMPILTPPRKSSEHPSVFFDAVNRTVFSACETFDNFLLDRFVFSEMVYAHLFKRESFIHFEWLKKLNKKILVFNTYCSIQDRCQRLDATMSQDDLNKDEEMQMELEDVLFKLFIDRARKDLKAHKNIHFASLNTSLFSQKTCEKALFTKIDELRTRR